MNGCLLVAGIVSLGAFALALGLAGSRAAAPPGFSVQAKTDPTSNPLTQRKLVLPETLRIAMATFPICRPTCSPDAGRGQASTTCREATPSPIWRATLGRVLFYDTRLSANNTTACGSCHLQSRAFSHPERFNQGFEGKRVDRNAMALVNLRYYPRGRFFWDERARTLEAQTLMPIQNGIEMGQDLTKLVQTLGKDDRYLELFHERVSASREITSERIGKGLAQFLRSLVSYQSKYDEGRAAASSVRSDFKNFTAQENRGKSLFLGRCATCHMPRGQDAHFIMLRPSNNGLDRDHKKSDGGVGDITLRGGEVGLFKSPSLRNVELTAPYMHDGRLATLEAVIDHYAREVKNHPNLDGRVRRARNIRRGDKAALIAFLKTLTDKKFITDPKFSDPFK